MPLAPQRSTLLRLIEAGHLARQALLAPLIARDLAPGDDALILGLSAPQGATREDLLTTTGLPEPLLDSRLRQLEERGLLLRLAVGPEMLPGARLSQQGQALRDDLLAHWSALEDLLRADLGRNGRKNLRRTLKAVIARLDPDDPA